MNLFFFINLLVHRKKFENGIYRRKRANQLGKYIKFHLLEIYLQKINLYKLMAHQQLNKKRRKETKGVATYISFFRFGNWDFLL